LEQVCELLRLFEMEYCEELFWRTGDADRHRDGGVDADWTGRRGNGNRR
jgi:hypothetical protein